MTMATTMYRRIIVPLDGSRVAEQALQVGQELGRALGLPLHLVRVVDPRDEPAAADEADASAAAGLYLDRLATRLADHAATVTTAAPVGDPARTIAGIAEPDDLIVLASHGRTGATRWLLGSVAESVLRHARAPVLLVPRAQRHGHGHGHGHGNSLDTHEERS